MKKLYISMHVLCRFSEYKRFRANSICIFFLSQAPPNVLMSVLVSKKKGAGSSGKLTTKFMILSAAQFMFLYCVFAVSFFRLVCSFGLLL